MWGGEHVQRELFKFMLLFVNYFSEFFERFGQIRNFIVTTQHSLVCKTLGFVMYYLFENVD